MIAGLGEYRRAAAAAERKWTPERRVVARFTGEEHWTELLLVHRAAPGVWAVVRPSEEVDVRCLLVGHSNAERILMVPTGGGRLTGCVGHIVRFEAVPSAAQIRRWRDAGRQRAAVLSATRLGFLLEAGVTEAEEDAEPALVGETGGPETPIPVAFAGPARGRLPDAAGQIWLFVEAIGESIAGEQVPAAAEGVALGKRALVQTAAGAAAAELVPLTKVEEFIQRVTLPMAEDGGDTTPRVDAPVDARVLTVHYDRLGRRRREWGSVVSELHEVRFDEWPISGPRTTNWVAAFFERRGTGPEDHHRWWRSVCHLQVEDWGVSEHHQCCRYLEMAGTYDQLDLGNIGVLELIARRLETIEFQYRERVKSHFGYLAGGTVGVSGSAAMTTEEAQLFEGADRVQSTVCCSPLLVKHVSEQLRDVAEVQKQARKAREEQASVHQGQHPGDDSGPGAEGGDAGGNRQRRRGRGRG